MSILCKWRALLGWVSLVLTLTSCGFYLRTPAPIPFKTVQLSGTSAITTALKKQLKAQGIKLVTDSADADLRLELLQEQNEKRILSLAGTGVVREFELYYRVQYRTKTNLETTWTLPLQIESRRDYTYDDINTLGKQLEERRLVENMQVEVMNGILRRLSALKNSP